MQNEMHFYFIIMTLDMKMSNQVITHNHTHYPTVPYTVPNLHKMCITLFSLSQRNLPDLSGRPANCHPVTSCHLGAPMGWRTGIEETGNTIIKGNGWVDRTKIKCRSFYIILLYSSLHASPQWVIMMKVIFSIYKSEFSDHLRSSWFCPKRLVHSWSLICH